MKLTKGKLIELTREGLIKIGYQEIKDTINGADGLFIKRILPDFFLSLGLTKSMFYDWRFTATFYLSKTTTWGALWGDMPSESYKRVAAFLTLEERKLYLEEEFNASGMIDGWWNADLGESVDKFLEVTNIAEPRFIAQEKLFLNISNSVDIKELVDQVISVNEIIKLGLDNTFDFQFIPDRSIDKIPTEWFKAAEIALYNNKSILNKNTVKRLAADAWRQKNIH